MQCRGSIFSLTLSNYSNFKIFFFACTKTPFFLRGRSSSDVQMFPSSEMKTNFASIDSKDESPIIKKKNCQDSLLIRSQDADSDSVAASCKSSNVW